MTSFDPTVPSKPGLLRAILDAIYGEDDDLAGVSVTRLTESLSATDDVMHVETTILFGHFTDGPNPNHEPGPNPDGKVIVGGEIVYAAQRDDTSFSVLSRGLEGSGARFHQQGTLVYDYSQNRTAVDALRRGIFVDYALGVDLDTVGRNLGVPKCRGLTEDQWREIIRRTAYQPKQPEDSFRQVLDVVFPGAYDIVVKPSEPWQVTVLLDAQSLLENGLVGRFFLNGGERQPSADATHVNTRYPIEHVLSVYEDTPLARMGFPGLDLFPGGSFAGSTITLGNPVAGAGVPLVVNYGAFKAHYLAQDETVVDRKGVDFRPYLSDEAGLASCLLDHVRAAGVRVNVRIRP